MLLFLGSGTALVSQPMPGSCPTESPQWTCSGYLIQDIGGNSEGCRIYAYLVKGGTTSTGCDFTTLDIGMCNDGPSAYACYDASFSGSHTVVDRNPSGVVTTQIAVDWTVMNHATAYSYGGYVNTYLYWFP